MANPARELHVLYSDWISRMAPDSTGAPRAMNSVIRPTSVAGAEEIIHAGRLLARISELLDQLERKGHNVGLYRRQLPDWTLGMIGYHGGWGSPMKARNVMHEEHMDEIEGFANFLDGKVPVLTQDGEVRLRDVTRQARDLLEQDDSLDPRIKLYIYSLLDEIQRGLDESKLSGSFDFAASMERLWVAMRAAEGSSKKASALWRDLWVSFATGLVSGGLIESGQALIAIAQVGGGAT